MAPGWPSVDAITQQCEQVAVQKSDLTPGHWTVRVSGFDIPDGPQTYAVAGMPDPDLLISKSSPFPGLL